MCLIAVAFRVDPRYPVVLAANRDEMYDRPAAPLHEWEGQLAGQDLTARGTWLSAAPGGRFAAVTNVREPGEQDASRSRGELPLAVTRSGSSLRDTVASVAATLDEYGPVNLLAGDVEELWWTSNRNEGVPVHVEDGFHGLSNAAFDTPWPKTTGAVSGMRRIMSAADWHRGAGTRRSSADSVVGTAGPDVTWAEPFFDLMADTKPALPWKLPETGVPFAHELLLSSKFVRMGITYGTRCTTVMRIDPHGGVEMVERRYDAAARPSGTVAAAA